MLCLETGMFNHFPRFVCFKVPEDGFEILNTGKPNRNYMKFSIQNKNIAGFEEIVQNDIISPEVMKQMFKRAADKVVVSKSDYVVMLDNGVKVKITRSDTVPYTLLLEPQSGEYLQTVEVDLIPALRVSNSKLPSATKTHLREIQEKAGTNVDHFLANAMPTRDKLNLEVDFPLVSREILSERPSAKMAVRLLKQERDETGGPMVKIWSHAIKVEVKLSSY